MTVSAAARAAWPDGVPDRVIDRIVDLIRTQQPRDASEGVSEQPVETTRTPGTVGSLTRSVPSHPSDDRGEAVGPEGKPAPPPPRGHRGSTDADGRGGAATPDASAAA